MITVIQKPQIFSPSDNPVIFQIESSDTAIVYFKVEILEATTNAVINKLDIHVTPDYLNGSYANLTRILRNAVNWQINNAQNILSLPVSKPILKYRVKITERGIFEGLMTDLSPAVLLPETFYVWNADLGRFRFHNFVYSSYVITSGLPARFLTFKPNGAKVNDLSSEQLYFLHESEDLLNLQVKTYNSSNVLLQTYSEPIQGIGEANIFRLQVSPKTLQASLLVDFDDVASYTIQLVDENADARTELRTYHYSKIDCSVEPVNLFWVNSLGGIDTYQFVNQTETNTITRSTYKKNPYRINDGFYTDRAGEILNTTEEVYNVTQQGNYTAQTQFITDAESAWLNELFISKQVFVELADSSLVPVIVTNGSYQIQKQRQIKNGFISTSVSYTLNGELIPSEAIAYSTGFGNGAIQLEFISDQMDSN